ncbi:MAG TPA: hypothetical protein H9874_04535 [Candidatus Bilophila faecipullorum]|uniref:Uncharacterized protein n=1 Tax=Candidatus Bilophila faecipullorum TaxID=2838482 RepID=A0A9D1R1J9_9BACT|nr:hypothetical protein [Candidatus Bilophila faecipullorum]
MLRGQEKRQFFMEAVAEAERSPDTKGMVLMLYVAREGGPDEITCVGTGAINKMMVIDNILSTLVEGLYGSDEDGGSDA